MMLDLSSATLSISLNLNISKLPTKRICTTDIDQIIKANQHDEISVSQGKIPPIFLPYLCTHRQM